MQQITQKAGKINKYRDNEKKIKTNFVKLLVKQCTCD